MGESADSFGLDQESSQRRRDGGRDHGAEATTAGPRSVEAPEAPVALAHDPRAAIAEALGSLMTPTQVTYLLQEILAINKRVSARFECSNCGHLDRGWADIPDAKAVVSALTDLLSQGFGRVGESPPDEASITLVRITNLQEYETYKREKKLLA
jgi:hypothetical protein